MAIAIRKSAAIALAAGLTFAGVGGVAIESSIAEAQVVSSIDDNQTRSLTIHKRIGQATNSQASGQVDATAAGIGNPGANVEYKIELVQALETSADWTAAAALDASNVAGITAVAGGHTAEGTTDDQGNLTFDNLPKGVYKVTETSAPAGTVIAPPFLAYVPMANPEGNGWIYNVHVYPKNTQATVTKTVNDANVHAGGNVEYRIIARGDSAAGAGVGTKFVFRDTLPTGLDAANATVTANFDEQQPTNLEADTDYTIAKNGQEITVTFTQAGRDKIVAANKRVAVTISAPYTGGDVQHVRNSASVEVGNATFNSDPVDTYWGSVTINKKNDQDQSLQGATFQLVQCQESNSAWTQLPNTQALTIGGQTEFTTDANGSVTIQGIHVENFSNNTQGEGTQYCVQETAAPAGYVGDNNLYPIELNVNNVDTNGAPTASIADTVEIKNSTSRNLLPNTGGMGILLLVLAGLGIVGAGAYAARRNAA